MVHRSDGMVHMGLCVCVGHARHHPHAHLGYRPPRVQFVFLSAFAISLLLLSHNPAAKLVELVEEYLMSGWTEDFEKLQTKIFIFNKATQGFAIFLSSLLAFYGIVAFVHEIPLPSLSSSPSQDCLRIARYVRPPPNPKAKSAMCIILMLCSVSRRIHSRVRTFLSCTSSTSSQLNSANAPLWLCSLLSTAGGK